MTEDINLHLAGHVTHIEEITAYKMWVRKCVEKGTLGRSSIGRKIKLHWIVKK